MGTAATSAGQDVETDEGRRIAALHAKWLTEWELTTDPGAVTRAVEREAEARILDLLRQRIAAHLPVDADPRTSGLNAALIFADIDALMPRADRRHPR